MSNVYKNAIYAPTSTANTTVYTCNATARAIIQNIQLANVTGTHTVSVFVFSYANSTTVRVSIDDIAAKTSINFAKGPIVLQERDAILISSESTSDVTGVISILEVNRGTLSN